MENKLHVQNLRISFRTSNGKVQAVRDISFDVAKGETLAIVGESGSGKSVTSKAILGIQAGNAITESGEIIYDGKDLLKINEEEFHKIRGDKIAMIFQDPMSSLDPIVKIGKQLTEAMILKGKARQRESRMNFNTYLKNLNRAMVQACADGSCTAEELGTMCKKFNRFEFKHIEMESAYNSARDNAECALESLKVLIFELEKNSQKEATYRVMDIANQAKASKNEYVVSERYDELKSLASVLLKQYRADFRQLDYSNVLPLMYQMRDILEEALQKKAPNFFRMGYYVTFHNEPLPAGSIEELDAFMLKCLNEEFMLAFISNAQKALQFTANTSYQRIEEAIATLKSYLPMFSEETLDAKQSKAAYAAMTAATMATVDPLSIRKDSLTYTFPASVKSELEAYFKANKTNKKAERVYQKEKRKYDRLVARGKTPDYEVAAAAVLDQNLIKQNITRLINRQVAHFEELLAQRGNRDFAQETIAAIDYLKENASGVVAKVTKQHAKARAIKLMEEVGIAEPHRRYYQYPFEFSGGMRQRIVIAIALAANPDILICDEPTTALDVTIQSQILELINKLKRERQLSVIFITHDLGVVANMADRVAVMYAGKIVEVGTSEDIFYDPKHPYTWALLSSMPDLDTDGKLEAIPGTPPNMIYPPVGDAFAERNKYAMQIDFERQPPMFQVSDTHFAATWLLHPDAPKVDPPKTVRDRIERMNKMRGADNAE